MFRNFLKRIQNVKDLKLKTIWSDHGGEFENKQFSYFCNKKGISHKFSFPRTPQQNGVVERKNRTLQECARTLLSSTDLPQNFWVETVATAYYVLNCVSLRPKTKNTLYELFFNKKPKVSYFKKFWFEIGKVDSTLFIKRNNNDILVVQMWRPAISYH